MLNGAPFTLTYPHRFHGIWWAEDRAGCMKVLRALATGELDADVLPRSGSPCSPAIAFATMSAGVIVIRSSAIVVPLLVELR